MPSLLRVIRKNRWIRNAELKWLAGNEVQADALGDLISKDNKLSFYEVDEANGVGLLRIAVALASNRENLANFDYALVNSLVLDELKVTRLRVLGETPDDDVNAAHWDLEQLTAKQLLMIAEHINSTQDVHRIQQAIIKENIITSVSVKTIDYAKIKLKEKDFLK